jgi:hypothetical protein
VKHSTKYAFSTLLGLIVAFFSTVPGHAQDKAKIKAAIPFNFVVGNKELKAGEYLVQQVGSPGSQNLQFRSENGDDQQMAVTVPIETNETGNHERLVFHRYGEQYFLSQVWLSGDEDGHELIPGAQEKKAATNQSAGTQVVAGQ